MGGDRVHAALLRQVLPSARPRGISGWIDAHVMPYGREPYYATAVELLALAQDDELLDVACGVGRLLSAHATRAQYVVGLDHSPDRVARARRRLADRIAAGTAEVVLGDASAP